MRRWAGLTKWCRLIVLTNDEKKLDPDSIDRATDTIRQLAAFDRTAAEICLQNSRQVLCSLERSSKSSTHKIPLSMCWRISALANWHCAG